MTSPTFKELKDVLGKPRLLTLLLERCTNLLDLVTESWQNRSQDQSNFESIDGATSMPVELADKLKNNAVFAYFATYGVSIPWLLYTPHNKDHVEGFYCQGTQFAMLIQKQAFYIPSFKQILVVPRHVAINGIYMVDNNIWDLIVPFDVRGRLSMSQINTKLCIPDKAGNIQISPMCFLTKREGKKRGITEIQVPLQSTEGSPDAALITFATEAGEAKSETEPKKIKRSKKAKVKEEPVDSTDGNFMSLFKPEEENSNTFMSQLLKTIN